jgi:hypothetical protein
MLNTMNISNKLRNQIWGGVWIQSERVWKQVYDQLDYQVYHQLRVEVCEQVRDGVKSQVRDQLWDQKDQVRTTCHEYFK